MRIDQIAERLRTDRVHLDPDIETDFPIIRKEAEDFAQAMREAKGRPDDAPRMYFSALVNDRSHAKNVDEFHDAIVVVVSVGGTNTHYRALEIKGGLILERTDVWKSLKSKEISPKIPTPCGDGAEHTLEEMLDPIVKGLLPWLEIFIAERKTPHILLNWGFPQKSVPVACEIGITGAIGQRMTKGQSLVQAEGREVHSAFINVLKSRWEGPQESLKGIGITVQNDTVMALYRYLERENRERYSRFGLMICGTGTNMTASEPYLYNREGSVVPDEEGYPLRWTRGKKPRKGCTAPEVWINFESGRLPLTRTRARVDRLLPGEADLLEDIENFGGSGTGFPRILQNMILDYMDNGEGVFKTLCDTAQEHELNLDGEFVVQLAGKHGGKSSLKLLKPLHKAGLSDEELQFLTYFSSIIVFRSALRNAEVLAALSLFSQFGLHMDEKPHAMALEGSIWKSTGYTDLVLHCWNRLVSPELQKLGRSQLNVEFLVKDDYNAGVLGPAYLLGQYL